MTIGLKKIQILLSLQIFLLWTSYALALEVKQFSVKHDKIIVVGTGANAMGVVASLIQNGVPPHHITVVEKESAAGGKVHSVVYNGKTYELGAQVIVPKLYSDIEKLRDQYGLTTRSASRGGGIDLATGQARPVITAEEVPAFKEQVGRYLEMYNTEWHNPNGKYQLLDADGYKNVPPSLKMTWPEFVKKNNFELIEKALLTLLGGTGYREINPTQAAIVVRVLSPLLMDSLIINPQPVQIFNEGYQELWKRMSQDFENQGVKFVYDTAVTEIERTGKRPLRVKTLSKSGKAVVLRTDHVMYTGDLSPLQTMLKNITPEEKAIFGEIVHSDYHSYLVEFDHVADLDGKSASRGIFPSIQGIKDENGKMQDVWNRPVLITKPHENANVAIVYVNGDGQASEEQIRENIIADFAKMGTTMRIIEGRRWKYHPRSNDDTETYFKKLMNMQGRGGLWLSGEALSYVATHSTYANGVAFAKQLTKNKLRIPMCKSFFSK